MSDPVVQTQTEDQRMREQLAQDAFTRDRMRRAAELAEQERIQQERQTERAKVLGAPIGVALGFAIVQRETWSGSITVEKTGAGNVTVIIDGKRLDALDVPDYLLKAAVEQKAAVPAVEEKVTQGFKSRTPRTA